MTRVRSKRKAVYGPGNWVDWIRSLPEEKQAAAREKIPEPMRPTVAVIENWDRLREERGRRL